MPIALRQLDFDCRASWVDRFPSSRSAGASSAQNGWQTTNSSLSRRWGNALLPSRLPHVAFDHLEDAAVPSSAAFNLLAEFGQFL